MEKGVSLYFTLIILSVLTAILLALINISVSQIKITALSGNSMIAFYAANTGAERILYKIKIDGLPTERCPTYIFSENLDNNATYKVCLPASTTIHSIGTYKNVQRKIELKID